MTVWVRASVCITGAQVVWSHPSPWSSRQGGSRSGPDVRATVTVHGDVLDLRERCCGARDLPGGTGPGLTRGGARTVVAGP